jgi:hypothetical protein
MVVGVQAIAMEGPPPSLSVRQGRTWRSRSGLIQDQAPRGVPRSGGIRGSTTMADRATRCRASITKGLALSSGLHPHHLQQPPPHQLQPSGQVTPQTNPFPSLCSLSR